MLASLKKILSDHEKKYPGWDEVVTCFFSSDSTDVINQNQELMDSFNEFIKIVVKYTKENDLKTEDIKELFEPYNSWQYLERYFAAELERFNGYVSLRQLAKDDIYKAKYCIDIIWSSYIIRFNPHLKFDQSVPLDERNFRTVSTRLDRFIDRCVDMQFHKDAIVVELEEESFLPQQLCEYIAEKIDKEFDQLRLNYLVHRISACEKAVDELGRKLSDLK